MTQIADTPIKVLCVEDEQFISELYNRALKKEGYEVRIVRSGAEGYELAKTGSFDVMLLDLMIPDMLGVDVLQKLRHEVPDLRTKIIITTNLEESDEVRQDIERQADGYLIKAEITPKQLVQFLNNLQTS
ncbi:MAG TPA: response regulator [Candidatus Saccharimonadales bacterium]|nr:response regulator [Candidatus Saccharimonadales bacterium]